MILFCTINCCVKLLQIIFYFSFILYTLKILVINKDLKKQYYLEIIINYIIERDKIYP